MTVTDRSKDSLIRLPEVKRRTGLSRTTIYRKMDKGEFPKSIPLGGSMVAWYESDVDRWVAAPLEWQEAA